MNNYSQIIKTLNLRNLNLPENIKQLKAELELIFDKKFLEAGVINPGYYSFFLPVLEKYRTSNIITKYHISEEQHTDGITGNLVKIPIVDIFLPEDSNSSIRLFIISNNFSKN